MATVQVSAALDPLAAGGRDRPSIGAAAQDDVLVVLQEGDGGGLRVVEASDSFRRIAPLAPLGVVAGPLTGARWAHTGFDVVAALCEATRAGERRRIEVEFAAADDSSCWIELSAVALRGAGGSAGFVVVGADITAQRVRRDLVEGQNAILRSIAAGVPLDATLDSLAKLCERIMPRALCSILRLDSHGRLRHCAAPSLPQSYLQAIDGVAAAPGVGSCGTAAAERRLVVVREIDSHPYWADFRQVAAAAGLAACWSACITDSAGAAIGTFAVYYRTPREPTEWELQVVEGLKDIAAIAIGHAEAVRNRARLISELSIERSHAELMSAQLKESEARFRDFTAASSDWYWEQDAELRFTFVSDSNEPISGMRSAEHYGKTRRETNPPGVGEEAWAHHEADLAARRPFRDFRFQRVDGAGKVRHLSINGVPVFDEDGVFRGYRGTGRDITAEVEALATLRAVIDAIPAMINAKDLESRYVLMNSYQARLYGTTPEAAVGRTAAELLGQGYGGYTFAIDRRVIETGQPTGFYEEHYAGVDGVERDWLTAKLPLFDALGQVRHVISVAMEISELKAVEQRLRGTELMLRRAMEKAEGESRAKSEFLANMSHELRTPLNAIIGFSEVMAQQLLGPLGNPRYGEYATDIHRSGTYLLELISDILDMAKIEAGSRDLEIEQFDAAAAIDDALRLVEARARAAQVTVDVAAIDRPCAVDGDRRAFRQIVLNLVGNAIKFTPAGGSVSIALRASGGATVLEVADTGIGIPEAELAHLGTPFFRVGRSEHAKPEGTGLGLAITRALVQSHGGTIEFASDVGVGTTVTVRLPDAAESAPVATASAAAD